MAWIDRLGLLFDFVAFWFVAPELLGAKRLQDLEGALEGLLEGISRLVVALWMLAFVLGIGYLAGWTLGAWGKHDITLPAWAWWGVVLGAVMSFALTAAATGADNPGPGRSILLPFRFWMGAAIAIDGWLGLYASYAGLAHIAWLALGAFVVLLGIAVLNGGRRGAFGRWLAGMGLVAGWCMVFARIGYSSLDVQQRPLFLAGVWVLMVQPWLPNVAIGLKRWVGLLQDDSLIRQRSLALGAWCFVLGFLLQLAATFGG